MEQRTRSASSAPKPEDGGNPNYWQEALASSLRSERKPNPTLIICGDGDCGKENLVKTVDQDGESKPHLLLDYTNIPFRDEDNDEEITRVNLWQVSDTNHMRMLQSVLKDVVPEDLCFCVVLDASKPETVKSRFFKWMKFIEGAMDLLTADLDPLEKDVLKERISRHMQFYTDPSDTTIKLLTEEEKAEIDTDMNNPSTNFGVPVMVVLAKAKHFGKRLNEAERNELFDTLINFVQKWSLDFGAACFSYLESNKPQARRIIGYAVHRIQGVPFRESPSIVVSISNLDEDYLLCPTGFTSPTILLGDSTPMKFEQCFPEGEKKETKEEKRAALQAERDDQVFYRTLQLDLEKVGPPDSSSPSTTAVPSTRTHEPSKTSSRKRREGAGASRHSTRPSSRHSKSTRPSQRGGQQQKEVVQNFFRHLLHQGGSPSSDRSQARRSQSRGTGGTTKHKDALRALETLANKTSKSQR